MPRLEGDPSLPWPPPVEDAHLTEEEWERLACGDMREDEREAALKHVTGCAECSRILKAIHVVDQEARSFDSGVPAATSDRAAGSRGMRQAVWAAAAIAAVFLLWIGLPWTQPPPPATPDGDVLRADSLVQRPVPAAPLGRLAAPPAAFVWDPIPGVDRYRVELLDGDADPLWSSAEVPAGPLPWPDDVQLLAGSYYWRVVALPDEASPIPSEMVTFESAE